MPYKELAGHARREAAANGAHLVGLVRVNERPEHAESIERILPGARSVLIVATRHRLGALRSEANYSARFDTIHAYDQTRPRGACRGLDAVF